MFFLPVLGQPSADLTKAIPATSEPVTITKILWKQRKIRMTRGSIRGFVPGRPGEDSIAFESLLERDTISWLLQMPETRRLWSQPFTLHYVCQEKRRKYTPDLLVEFTEVPAALEREGFGRFTVIECKPPEELPKNERVLALARAGLEQITSAPFVVVLSPTLRVAAWEDASHD